MGEAALAGDPHAQGAAIANVGTTALGAAVLGSRIAGAQLPIEPMSMTPSFELSAAAPGVIEAQAARAAARSAEQPTLAADATYQQLLNRRAQRLLPPD